MRIVSRAAAKAVAVIAATALLGACGGSPQAHTITITFIRHAESESNAAGVLDTTVPGPSLTPKGKDQAEQVAHDLARNNYDGIYASTMVRTQQTAAPLAAALGKQVEVLPGVQEIDAGWFEGKPVSMAASTYLVAPTSWLQGDVQDRIPGSVSGTEFNNQVTGAVQKIYASGHRNPVVFSHVFTIMFWTLMNVKNPRDSLLTSHPLPNTGRVVITGNPATGWTLVDWDGIRDLG